MPSSGTTLSEPLNDDEKQAIRPGLAGARIPPNHVDELEPFDKFAIGYTQSPILVRMQLGRISAFFRILAVSSNGELPCAAGPFG